MAKGIILGGGTGSRLAPLTRTQNKHLLPCYNMRMIELPLSTIVNAGIKDVILVTGGNEPGSFLELLKNGAAHDINRLFYTYQEGSGGVADALRLAEPFLSKEHALADEKEPCVVVLGDNYFEEGIKQQYEQWKSETGGQGAGILLKTTETPWHFGIAEVKDGKVISIEEKPSKPRSDLAILGGYFFDGTVWDYVNHIEPSSRGELEITDVLRFYMHEGKLRYYMYDGYWSDMGTFSSWMEVSTRLAKLGS